MTRELTFGERIKLARTEQGRTIKGLASDCGIAQKRIKELETGVEPKWIEAVKLARALPVTLDWLAGLTQNGPKRPVNSERLQEILFQFDIASPRT